MTTTVSKFMVARTIVVVMMAWLIAAPPVMAQPTGEANNENTGLKETLRQQSLDPTSNLKQFQIQNRFIPSTFGADGYANILTNRIVYPIPASRALPRQLWRADFPIVTAPGGLTGLSDIRLLGFGISGTRNVGNWGWWRYGLGPVFVFPTETEDRLGSGKWQIGPTVGAILGARKWQLAIIILNPISFAGKSNRPDVNRLIWQPIVSYFLEEGWYLGLQGTPKSVNWENDAALTFPVSARIGKVFKLRKRYINLFVEPEYTAVHEEEPVPEWSIQLGFNFLFPL